MASGRDTYGLSLRDATVFGGLGGGVARPGRRGVGTEGGRTRVVSRYSLGVTRLQEKNRDSAGEARDRRVTVSKDVEEGGLGRRVGWVSGQNGREGERQEVGHTLHHCLDGEGHRVAPGVEV